MRRLIASILAVLLLTFTCQSQEQPPKMELNLGGVTYIQEVPPDDGVRLNKHILFIFDCSGSMNAGKVQEALTFFTAISSQPIDQMEFAVLAFDSPDSSGAGGLYRWPGIPEPDLPVPVPEGWAALPSGVAIQRATAWINDTRGHAGGGTHVAPAIQQAYQEARGDLSIVLVTDGNFNDDVPVDSELGVNEYIVAVMRSAIRAREANEELSSTAMMVYGVGSHRRTNLAELARLGGAGYYRKKPPPPKQVEEEPPQIYGPHHR
jgi:hypothetical protein